MLARQGLAKVGDPFLPPPTPYLPCRASWYVILPFILILILFIIHFSVLRSTRPCWAWVTNNWPARAAGLSETATICGPKNKETNTENEPCILLTLGSLSLCLFAVCRVPSAPLSVAPASSPRAVCSNGGCCYVFVGARVILRVRLSTCIHGQSEVSSGLRLLGDPEGTVRNGLLRAPKFVFVWRKVFRFSRWIRGMERKLLGFPRLARA